MLRAILRAHVAGERAAVPYYSLRLGTGTSGLRPLQELYQGNCRVARARSPSRVVAALTTGLSDLADDGLARRPRVSVLGIVREGRALLLPARLRADLAGAEPQLAAIGAAVIDALQVGLEPGTGAVIVPDLHIEVDQDVLVPLTRTTTRTREDPVAPAGRYPVSAWVVSRATGRATVLTHAMRLVTNLDRLTPQLALETVAASLRSTRLVECPRDITTAGLADMVDGLLPA